jgi:hypothetical protein
MANEGKRTDQGQRISVENHVFFAVRSTAERRPTFNPKQTEPQCYSISFSSHSLPSLCVKDWGALLVLACWKRGVGVETIPVIIVFVYLSVFQMGLIFGRRRIKPQSRQSAKPFLQSSELGLPPPLTRRRVCPPPGSGGRGTLAGEKGGGRVPIPTRGHTLWYSIFLSTLWIKQSRGWVKGLVTVQIGRGSL